MMKQIKSIFLITLIIFFFTNCGGPKTDNIVVIHKDSTMYAVGEPQIKFNSKGARYDYFIPGAIIVFKADYTVLKQKGTSGKVYRISRDTILQEIGSIDTSLNDTIFAKKYLIKTIDYFDE